MSFFTRIVLGLDLSRPWRSLWVCDGSILAALLLLLFVGTGCVNDTTQSLTPPTNSGANTLSCLVNGAVWLPTNDPNQGFLQLGATYQNGALQIVAYHTVSSTDQGAVELDVSPIYSTGSYTLDNTSNYGLYFDYARETRAQQYRTDDSQLGKIVVTQLDTVDRIVSGTFSFDAENSLGNTVSITDGRFDIPY